MRGVALLCWLAFVGSACYRASGRANLLDDGAEPRWLLRYPAHVAATPIAIEYRSEATLSDSHSGRRDNDVLDHQSIGTLSVARSGTATVELASRVRAYSLNVLHLDGQRERPREVHATQTYAVRQRALDSRVTGTWMGTPVDGLLLRVLPTALPDQAVGPGASWSIVEGETKTIWTVLGARDGRVLLRGTSSRNVLSASERSYHSHNLRTQVDLAIDFATLHFEATLTGFEDSASESSMSSSRSDRSERAKVVVDARPW